MYIRKKRFVTVIVCVAVFSFLVGSTATQEIHAANDLYAGLTLFTNVGPLSNAKSATASRATARVRASRNSERQTVAVILLL